MHLNVGEVVAIGVVAEMSRNPVGAPQRYHIIDEGVELSQVLARDLDCEIKPPALEWPGDATSRTNIGMGRSQGNVKRPRPGPRCQPFEGNDVRGECKWRLSMFAIQAGASDARPIDLRRSLRFI